ncbi:MAG: RluA family pseudouridine synthase [Pseudomonadota bacterium]|nr:RluA family pseudouridine synthase [Pseudomonadota bacterium]
MEKFGPVIVSREEDGQRLDKWLKSHYSAISKVMIQKLCRTGQVRIDSLRVRPNTRVLVNQKVRVPVFIRVSLSKYGAQAPKVPSKFIRDLKDAIIFDDEYFIIFNKPSGVPVQGGSKLGDHHIAGALPEFKPSNNTTPRLVHRLDKDTSGVLIVAKTPKSAASISKLMKERQIKKIYWALVHSWPRKRSGIIFTPAKSNVEKESQEIENLKKKHNYRIHLLVLDKEEKESLSMYKILGEVGKERTWLELVALTGRKHQLRRHMASIGCPIIGDRMYGDYGKKGILKNKCKDSSVVLEKLQLHARRVEFIHPFTKKDVRVEADPPHHMSKMLKLF